MKTIKHAALKLGLFVLISVLLAGYLAITLRQAYSEPTTTYRAYFKDASELKAGQQVRIAGVVVGNVDNVALGPHNLVQVTFDVDRSRPLTLASTAVVRYKDLIGNRYLEVLDNGSNPTLLAPGSAIPDTRTSAALNLDTLFNGFKPLFQGLNPDQINQVSTALIQVLQGQSGSVYTLLSTIGSLTTTLTSRNDLIGQVIGNLDSALTVVAQHGTDVSSIIQQMQALTSGLEQDAPTVLNAMASINAFTSSAAGLLQAIDAPLGVDLTGLQSVARILNKGNKTVQYALDHLGPAYQRMMRVGAYGNFFNIYVCALRLKLNSGKNVILTPYYARSDVKRCQ
ncbi:MAG TPA: MCE family protein [Marmoricola sp.]|nr:MCE family protein [Marmoricola sp.]